MGIPIQQRRAHLKPGVDAAVDLHHRGAEEHLAEEEGLVEAVLLDAADEVGQDSVAETHGGSREEPKLQNVGPPV